MNRRTALLATSLPLAVLYGPISPLAHADSGSQYVRTESGRVRCLVMANDQGQGPAVACEAGGCQSTHHPTNLAFPKPPRIRP